MMAIAKNHNSKTLGDLIDGLETAVADIPVAILQLDSRLIAAGDVFVACAGAVVDGRDYIDSAISQGAVAVLIEADAQWQQHGERSGVPLLVVDALPVKLSAIAGRLFDQPSTRVPVIGVTGTNGKTSCTQLIMQLLNHLQRSCGVIGTLGVGVDGELNAGVNTTPDAVAVQQVLAQWCEADVAMAAMEVSSHGLEQGRIAAVNFETALFTNLTRDHLDYHGTMAAYGDAKKKLFQQSGLKTAVLNGDDEFASEIRAVIAAGVRVLT